MMNLELKDLEFQEITAPLLEQKEVSLSVARLDGIHPIVSGNKLFKLHYFLNEAAASSHKQIITFGGAYSNHLVATAFATQQMGLKSLGIVRGERPEMESHSLLMCREYGMKLQFVSRDLYKNKADAHHSLLNEHGDSVIIPEGGYHPDGARGASLIMGLLHKKEPTHICLAIGTATTIAGLLAAASPSQKMIGIPVLKNLHDITTRLEFLTGKVFHNCEIHGDYHFGGYARSTPELFNFMNAFYQEHHVPLDFVYTGKMMYGAMDLIRKGFFPARSRIICLHTGGLQGNQSLPKGTLIY